jgi:hypothetical protein
MPRPTYLKADCALHENQNSELQRRLLMTGRVTVTMSATADEKAL